VSESSRDWSFLAYQTTYFVRRAHMERSSPSELGKGEKDGFGAGERGQQSVRVVGEAAVQVEDAVLVAGAADGVDAKEQRVLEEQQLLAHDAVSSLFNQDASQLDTAQPSKQPSPEEQERKGLITTMVSSSTLGQSASATVGQTVSSASATAPAAKLTRNQIGKNYKHAVVSIGRIIDKLLKTSTASPRNVTLADVGSLMGQEGVVVPGSNKQEKKLLYFLNTHLSHRFTTYTLNHFLLPVHHVRSIGVIG
jgi:hypothetical protein